MPDRSRMIMRRTLPRFARLGDALDAFIQTQRGVELRLQCRVPHLAVKVENLQD